MGGALAAAHIEEHCEELIHRKAIETLYYYFDK